MSAAAPPRRVFIARGVLWFMRIGILCMLATAAVFLYGRYHKSDEQLDLIRYVEIDIPALDNVEMPLVLRIQALLEEKRRQPEDVRHEIVDDLMPGLVRLRKLSEAPLRAARTQPVKALAAEYQNSVESLIAACRAMLQVIDDPKLDANTGFAQVRAALHAAAQKNQEWRRHLEKTRDEQRLAPASANSALLGR